MGDGEMWRRWETSTRYYVVLLHRDLLGDWVLTVAHGGRSNNLGPWCTVRWAPEKRG